MALVLLPYVQIRKRVNIYELYYIMVGHSSPPNREYPKLLVPRLESS